MSTPESTCAECGKPAVCNDNTDCCAACERKIMAAHRTREQRERFDRLAARHGIKGRYP